MGLCRINMEYSFAVGGMCARACVCACGGERGRCGGHGSVD